jgi:hypothetical protein
VKGKLFNSGLNFVIVATGVQCAIAVTTSVVSKDVTVFAKIFP